MALCCFSNEVQDVQDRGPVKSNKCTDFTFLIFFLGFCLGLTFISAYVYVLGNPLRMIHGSDSFGNVCGYKNDPIDNFPLSGQDLTKRPYLFHLKQEDPENSIKICVHKCPDRRMVYMADIYSFWTRTNSSLCRYDYGFSAGPPSSFRAALMTRDPNSSFSTVKNLVDENGLCPELPVGPTRRMLYHCVPEVAVTTGVAFGHSFYEFLSSYVPLKKIFSDVMNSYNEMMIMAVVAIVASFLSAFVIHFVAFVASWVILVLISVFLILLTIVFWWAYVDTRYRLQTLSEKFSFILPEDSENESILLTISIICTVLTIVILYAASSMRSHVQFVVALFHETAACIRSMPFLLIQPLWTLCALICFLVFWFWTMLALCTANYASREHRYLQSNITDRTDEVRLNVHTSRYTLISYKDDSWIQYTWWYLVIALIWISEFILSCQQIVIAGAVSSWYFSRDRNSLNSPILGAIRDLFCRHMGSVALGSFLITLFKLPRLIIQQVTSRLRQYENSRLAKTALEACSCCLWVVERFLAYLTRNAYTVVVIEQTPFCTSARLAFQAMVSNAIRVAAINSIGDFILFLGKLMVAALTAIVGVFLVRANPFLHYWTVPVILMTLFAFWIAHCLLSVYEMVIDAMFLCFCQDMNRNDGSPGSEYYAPESLMQFLVEDEQLAEIRARQGINNQENKPENDYSTVI